MSAQPNSPSFKDHRDVHPARAPCGCRAMAHAHPANPPWRDWMGLTKVPVHDDCFLQQRLSLDRSNGLQVRSVKVCY